LNDAGKMVERWYFEMQNKYPNIRCHEMVVMPNHFHCIIEISDGNAPETNASNFPVTDAHVGAPLRGRPNATTIPISIANSESPTIPEFTPKPYGTNNQKYNATIGNMMDWFKTMTTNEYIRGVKNHGWQRFNGKLWQRNYWEHIIRDDAGLDRIANYIVSNPENWQKDQFNTDEN
jgi:REP element-mobilizing transposase RayT